jgi:putative cardiolipin synthase
MRTVITVLILMFAGCSALKPASEFPRTPSYALADPTVTRAGAALAEAERAHPQQSGFYLLPGGSDALLLRLALAEVAERTLDVQYYIYRDDHSGRTLTAALLRAADRGVRVRVLLDDLNLRGDVGVATLDGHPNIEIRVFNPFSRRRTAIGRLFSIVGEVPRLNRRMHNKSFIADNAFAIIGGRNIGNEYFDASRDLGFSDLDVMGAGQIAREISASFDDYWNSDSAYPPQALGIETSPAERLEELRETLRLHAETQRDTAYARNMRSSELAQQLRSQQLPLIWGRAELSVDLPEKVTEKVDEESLPIGQLADLALTAQRELLIISPYFVPGEGGAKFLIARHQDGIAVRVLTNSLAATDVAAVHAGYATYRRRLLRGGIELYELKPQPETLQRRTNRGLGSSGSSSSSLHAKTFVVDGQRVAIGSLNLDPRSTYLNTELGVIVDSPELARQVVRAFEEAVEPSNSYRIALEGSALRWHTQQNGGAVILRSEPEAGFWRRATATLLRLLPIESLL